MEALPAENVRNVEIAPVSPYFSLPVAKRELTIKDPDECPVGGVAPCQLVPGSEIARKRVRAPGLNRVRGFAVAKATAGDEVDLVRVYLDDTRLGKLL